MKLLEIHIENFGKLSNFNYQFSQTFNAVFEKNGWGKSTIAMFLKAMFYGLSGSSKRSVEENERKKFMPWNNSGVVGGSVVFLANGKTYKLTRVFNQTESQDTFFLTNTQTGKPSTDYSQNIGFELFGVNAEGFERSVFNSSKNLLEQDKKSLTDRANQLLQNTNASTNLAKAVEMLEKKRAKLKNLQNSGEIPELESKLTQLETKESELNQTAQNIAVLTQELEKMEQTEQKLLEELKAVVQNLQFAKEQNVQKQVAKQHHELKQTVKDTQTAKQQIENEFVSVPTQQAVEELEQKVQQWQVVKQLKAQAAQTNESKLSAMFASGVPSDVELNHYQTLLNTPSTQPTKQPLIALWFVLAFVLVAAGTLLVILGQLWSVVFLVFGFGFSFAGLLTKTNQTAKPNTSNDHLELVKQFVEKFFKPNEYTNLQAALLNLQMNVMAYRQALQNKQQLLEQLKQYDDQQTQLENHFATFGSAYLKTQWLDPTDLLKRTKEKLLELEKQTQLLTERSNLLTEFERQNSAIIHQPVLQVYDLEALETKKRELEGSYEVLTNHKAKANYTLGRYQTEVEKLADVVEEKQSIKEQLAEKKETLKLVKLTKDFLVQAQENITSMYLNPMKTALSKYANLFQLNALGNLELDTDLKLKVEVNNIPRELDYFSSGYKTALEIALRLALVDVLFTSEQPFLVFDDPFVHLDDEKQAQAKQLLQKVSQEKQVLYFTCSSSRM